MSREPFRLRFFLGMMDLTCAIGWHGSRLFMWAQEGAIRAYRGTIR